MLQSAQPLGCGPDSVLPPDALPAVVLWDLNASDVERARAFYHAVFGWTIGAPGDAPVRLAEIDAGPGSLPGVLGQAPGAADPDVGVRHQGLILYIKVHDVAAALASVVAHGGRAVWGPTEVSPGFWLAQFEDPDGTRIGLTS
jgi:predicted enzyme related to lactoylglutathione lyase